MLNANFFFSKNMAIAKSSNWTQYKTILVPFEIKIHTSPNTSFYTSHSSTHISDFTYYTSTTHTFQI
jgi:hypothetical protein